VNESFKRWGLPQQIKIDNGYPFVNPKHRDVPTYAKLWWIGLGIKVIQNRPGCPQENGIVECLQGVLCNWSNPGKHTSIQALQNRIDEESEFQRNYYRIPSKGNKTRIELFPDLENNPRKYNPDDFDIGRIHKYLCTQVWTRHIKDNGQIKFWGQSIYVGTKLKKEEVIVTFDPEEIQWMVTKSDGTLLKTSKKNLPDPDHILEFATMSKNEVTT